MNALRMQARVASLAFLLALGASSALVTIPSCAQGRLLARPHAVKAVPTSSVAGRARFLVSWQPVAGATSYKVFCSLSDTTFPAKPLVVTHSTFVTLTVKAGQKGFCRVQASRGQKEGLPSTPVGIGSSIQVTPARVLPKVPVPSAPQTPVPALPSAPPLPLAPPLTGYYRLMTRGDKAMSLAAADFGNSNGTQVVGDVGGQTSNQRWKLEQQDDGSYKLRAYSGQNSNEVLDLANAEATPGNKVALWESNNNPAQLWYLQGVGGGYFRIVPKSVNAGIDLTLEVKGGTLGGTMDIAPYVGGDNQVFRFEEFGGVQLRSGLYRITRRGHPELSLSAVNEANVPSPSLVPTSDDAKQKWKLERQPDGSYKVTVFIGQDNDVALDLVNGDAINGNLVRTWSQNGADAQQWYFQEVGGGCFRILSKKSGVDADQTVEVGDGTDAKAGSGLRLFPYAGTDNQVFRLEDLQAGKK